MGLFRSEPRPSFLGVKLGKLSPVYKGKKNSVSSQTDDIMFQIDPFPYTGLLEEARKRLTRAIRNMPRHHIVHLERDYIYVEFKVSLFGGMDDTEFYFDDPRKVIHVRSAARAEDDDKGRNRNRVENIRDEFNKAEFADHQQ